MKQKPLTQSLSWLHTWDGLVFGWILFSIFLTGTLAVFDKEIDGWMRPEIPAHSLDKAQSAQRALDYLQHQHPDASAWNIGLATERSPSLTVSAGEQRRGGWEVRVFFAVWLLSLGYAVIRPWLDAWREQLGLTALLCIGLPALNLLGGNRGDHVYLEVTTVLMGLLLAWTCWKLSQPKQERDALGVGHGAGGMVRTDLPGGTGGGFCAALCRRGGVVVLGGAWVLLGLMYLLGP
ncbi:PepSY-associated TM region [Pseudomonas taetrolens]|uniref:PepSY-associated TM region n=1 Tax=Pseudomonas taetrolens TaxID=47884 RepID=A0A0J6GQK0_PSETA|nr:PepSY-associated TM helix domain-containing protein [Pseudomonas taetrolens]KMM84394.1 hypothetical protein TU78_14350 [Pseudomonas taetrolens]SEC53860.1 PepSY-associated TM region [Pseudomonas taetrolens]SQF86755.1 PepSY-associated TM helix domain-containing protein [Pseudomonas taetrolens]VEH49831.1 PepSY-associated TM helix domain-containing protein [Pseudomonas taetrolens]